MTKGERVKAALESAEADRPPFSLWYHFHREPVIGEGFARATLQCYRAYDPDLLKVMHDAPYDLPVDRPVFEKPEDWMLLPVNPPDAGNFGEHRRTLRMIAANKNDDAPMVDTVFSVFATAQQITGGRVLEHLDADPEGVAAGLKRLAAALAGYANALMEDGTCAGIYLAVSGADAHTMPAERYKEVFLPLDEMVLCGAVDAWCSIVHLHGDDLHVDALLPLVEQANAVSWSDRAAGPSLAAMREKTGMCLMGGVDERLIAGYTPEQVREEIRDALTQVGDKGLIVAPGCAVPTETPPDNLRAFKEAVQRG